MVPYTIPILGHAIQFGQRPIDLLYGAYQKVSTCKTQCQFIFFANGRFQFGEVFRIRVVGNDFTFLVGLEAQKAFFESKEEVCISYTFDIIPLFTFPIQELCARKAYTFTIPVFGKNVVYDSPHEDFQQQRQFVAGGLTIKRFRHYVDLIIEETENYLDENWKDSGEVDLLEELNFITIVTSTRTIQGNEVRTRFNKEFSKLYLELDKALGPISFFFPHLPIPTHSRRDQAREAIGGLYKAIIDRRKKNGIKEEDLVQTLIDSKYSDGREINDDVVTGMCVALLLAGQHTSNVTSTWLGVNMFKDPEIERKVREEQESIFPNDQPFEMTYDHYKKMHYMEACVKESLRLVPPIMAVFRRAEVDWKYKDYVIPKGSLVGVSPSVSMRLPEAFEDPDTFNPDRFLNEATLKKYSYIAFSAGRHACIGEKFAYLQVMTIWSVLLRRYNFELLNKDVKPDFTTMIVSPVGPITVKYSKRNLK